MIYVSAACAAFATLCITLLVAGLMPIAESIVSVLMIDLVTSVPLILGVGAASGAYSANRGNPIMLWIAGIWNALMLGFVGLLLFMSAIL